MRAGRSPLPGRWPLTARRRKPWCVVRPLRGLLPDQTRLPLDRLRKEVAFERLLARLAATASVGSWALKGGLAMIARAGGHARPTADVDTTWRADVDDVIATLRRAASTDLFDHFEFIIGELTTLQGERPGGGLRFPVRARLAGRLFESVRLDVNLSPDDAADRQLAWHSDTWTWALS